MDLAEFPVFLKCEDIHTPAQIKEIIKKARKNYRFSYTNTNIKYFNIPCAFDIETTSFFRSTGNEEEKIACMYVWTFGIYGLVIMGRTWEEFITMLNDIIDELQLNLNKRIIIYVHNLGYEFQFMRKWLNWFKVFSSENRKPIYAVTDTGIEFRCSYILSGYSLEKLADNLHFFNIKKLIGNLNYDKLRHNKTPLNKKEIAYCINDTKIVMAYVAERIMQDDGISKIPLTKTGYVRKFCKNNCFYEDGKPHKKSLKRVKYMEIMRGLKLTPEEYKQLKRAFQGGFTHANPFYSGKVVNNVTSFDFTSSYPAVMVAEKFPMSSGELITIKSSEELEKNLNLYCCLFDIEFINLRSKLLIDSYISLSRCWEIIKPVVNNGRVVSADRLCTTITEQDFLIIKKFYEWDKVIISNFRRYKKDYLPTDFIKSILKLYMNKTILKGVSGKEVEYLISKEMLNSCYGMSVTDIIRIVIEYYNNEWQESIMPDIEKEIKKYNNSRGRFLYYPWGVWVTAYARRNLFTGILEFNEDYIYSDTDSIKVINVDKHLEYINKYNDIIKKQLYIAMDYHGLPYESIEPKTKKGIIKTLGVWDFDGQYSKFKTLGAKRYIYQYSKDIRNGEENYNKINITVSGVNKKICVPWMIKKWGKRGIFNAFADDLYIPANFTGKMTHTYIDEEKQGILIDYLGVPGEYHELSFIHLEKSDYSLSISQEYSSYLSGIQIDY